MIGERYASTRREDPQLAAAIVGALGASRTVLNVGAGAGSYEPRDRDVLAFEPSDVMAGQRPDGAAPALRLGAGPLPLRDASVDAALAVLTIHHWHDQLETGVRELRSVARGPVVIVTYDTDVDAAGYLVAVLGDVDPVDSDVHRFVRQRATDEAAAGHADLCARVALTRQHLAVVLPASDLQHPITVIDGVVLPLTEYLRTRTVELVVHLDDVCASIGADSPDDLGAAFDVAAGVLAQVAVRRAGPWATLRSLARRERHPSAVRAL